MVQRGPARASLLGLGRDVLPLRELRRQAVSCGTETTRPKPWKLIIRWDHPGPYEGSTKTVPYQSEETRKSREQAWVDAGWTIVGVVNPDA